MKGGTAALKEQMASIDLGEIEDNLDDMAELLEESNEIQEVDCFVPLDGLSYACDLPLATVGG